MFTDVIKFVRMCRLMPANLAGLRLLPLYLGLRVGLDLSQQHRLVEGL